MNASKQTSTALQDVVQSRIVLLSRFDTKPGELDAFILNLGQVVDIMRKETSFIDAVISQSVDRPNELLMYETWHDDREHCLGEELPAHYRAAHERALADLVVSRQVKWFTPLTSWHSSLDQPGISPTS
jgi:quinol monooxygenase YgiN